MKFFISLVFLLDCLLGLGLVASLTFVCNNKSYDPSNEICCEQRLIKIRDNKSKCCANRIYDSSLSVCCNDQIIPNVNSSSSEIETQCICGIQNYNPLLMGCCRGNEIYALDEYVCCNDNLLSKRDGKIFCCDDQNYNPNDSYCLSGGYTTYPEFRFNTPRIVSRLHGPSVKKGECPTKLTANLDDGTCVFENCFDDSNCPDSQKCCETRDCVKECVQV